MSQIEIAHELQVSEASINSDMQFLRNQAKESRYPNVPKIEQSPILDSVNLAGDSYKRSYVLTI